MVRDEGKLVTIFGGSGFIGTQVTQELARRGYRIRVAVRRPDLAGHVRMFGFPGQIQPVQANLRFPDSVRAAVRGAAIVINLVGVLADSGRQRFSAVHVAGARTVAEAAAAAGAERLIHISALGADLQSPSAYARSKARGEADVLAAYPQAVILRPSLVFGQDDRFLNRFASIARLSPVLPVIGGETRFQPVYVGDVAEAIARAADGAGKGGRIYELGGPEIMTMREILERVNAETQRNRVLLPVPVGLARFGAGIAQILPGAPVTADQMTQLTLDNVVSPEAAAEKRTLAAFDVQPTAMDAVISTYLWRFRRHGEFGRRVA